MKMKFKDLPKGARFKFPDGTDIWVVLKAYNHGLVAKWSGFDTSPDMQSLCSFCDDEWSLESEVEIAEPDVQVARLLKRLAAIQKAFDVECEFYDPQDMQEWAHNIEIALNS